MKVARLLAVVLVCTLAPACGDDTTSGPSATNLTGTWVGTSTYPNAPFQLSLSQTNGAFKGEYQDRLDRSLAVTGTFSTPRMEIVVDFGDAKLNIQGTVQDGRTVQGVMFTSALGNREYPFSMTR